jgi:perosamine synthetase
MTKIPVAATDLSGHEEAYVVEAIRSSWISSTGPFVSRFESTYASLCEVDATVSVSNGTVAMHLALLALGAGPGDEVLIPSMTYIATANVVRYVGAEPVFVDIDPATWCINPLLLAQAISPRTKGIIAVHLYGHPADMDPINAFAAEHGLWVVEDAAEAHLARYKGRRVGGLGDVAAFSFYGNKIFTSGEGGALTLSDSRLEAKIRLLRGQGMDPLRRYYFPIVGYNYRLTNVACAILCAQLERHEQIMGLRRAIFEGYREALAAVPGIGFQPQASWAEPAPWLFGILVDSDRLGRSRDELATELASCGIETRPFFVPIHTLPPYQDTEGARRGPLPVTDALGANGLSLPTFNALSREEIGFIGEQIRLAAR